MKRAKKKEKKCNHVANSDQEVCSRTGSVIFFVGGLVRSAASLGAKETGALMGVLARLGLGSGLGDDFAGEYPGTGGENVLLKVGGWYGCGGEEAFNGE